MNQLFGLQHRRRTDPMIEKATAHRIGVLKEAEKRELDITSKAADYIQQQTNGNASDWIINGVFNKGKNK